jgi:hypothetical protein
MARRSCGEGSVTLRADGRWQAAMQIAGQRRTIYGKSRSEVAHKLRALSDTARDAGRLPISGNLTLAAFLAHWLNQAEAHLRPTTLCDYRVVISKHVSPQIGHLRLSRLSALHVANHERTTAARCSPVISSRLRRSSFGPYTCRYS